jgi:hypothetical protein
MLLKPDLSFFNIYSFFKTIKQERKVISIIISYIGYWLNYNPIKVAKCNNNKPLF